ncbi:unnamed protein product [Eruca vesicaria subsp. sativa]|uniref:Uncharacterized protein n=1 Tax=Eruca vesicaria subsp. sativa TaxID=29727 RepID=A0ABC8JG00_ERUVS|nr:unnamed protein product [Eruca vesicaria subsp. sativa]
MAITLFCFVKLTEDISPLYIPIAWIQITTSATVIGYTLLVAARIGFGVIDRVPGRRRFPYAFTLAKSIVQILVLLAFTSMDDYMKKQRRVFVVTAVVSMHIHLVSVFFAFHLGEDCDVLTAFLSVSFTLVYELAKGWLSTLALFIVAIMLMWIKNLLFLYPPPNPEVRNVEVVGR